MQIQDAQREVLRLHWIGGLSLFFFAWIGRSIAVNEAKTMVARSR